MLLYPSIDKLSERENSKYKLIILASKRAHEIQKYKNKQLEHYQSVKPVGKALEEVQAGLLYVKDSEVHQEEN